MQILVKVTRRRDGFAWPDQDIFFQSPAGKEYDKKLIAIYDRDAEE